MSKKQIAIGLAVVITLVFAAVKTSQHGEDCEDHGTNGTNDVVEVVNDKISWTTEVAEQNQTTNGIPMKYGTLVFVENTNSPLAYSNLVYIPKLPFPTNQVTESGKLVVDKGEVSYTNVFSVTLIPTTNGVDIYFSE